MDDIAPELLEKIQRDFKKKFDSDGKLADLAKKLEAGTATHMQAYEYAGRVGSILTDAYKKHISVDSLPDGKLWYNIADRVITPTMKNNYDIIAKYVSDVQEKLNRAAGLHIKAVKPELNEDRIKGIVDKVSNSDNYKDVEWVLDTPIKTFSQSVVDDAIKANVEFHAKAGLQPKIVRKTSGNCCKWCSQMAGTYDYPDVPKDVYRRHGNCNCVVEYDPGDGRRQNVHTKKWQTQEERDIIEARKVIGLSAEDDEIIKNIRKKIIPNQKIDDVISRQQIHRVGSELYEQRRKALQGKGQYGPSYVTVSDEKILELVHKYSGKGKIKYNKNGVWNNQEVILTNDEIIGVVIDNRTGKSAETSVFKIHYSENGVHIVPDYPSKKR